MGKKEFWTFSDSNPVAMAVLIYEAILFIYFGNLEISLNEAHHYQQ